MTGLIQAVQKPAFDKLGAFDLETFFPGEGPPQARDADQQPHRLAGLRHVDAGRAARRAAAAVHAPRASRASRSSPSRISTMPSACSSSRWCSTRSSRGCARSRAPSRCAPFSTWTRSSASFRRPRTRRPSCPCSRCSSRRAPSAWAACSRRRIPSTSTTRVSPTAARGSSAGCRPSATSCASSKV